MRGLKIEVGQAMKTQHKTIIRRNPAKDREFERLLRRAALYAKAHPARNLTVAGKKRVQAA
jgi:hypothetical protein